jgi:hypothetical protein
LVLVLLEPELPRCLLEILEAFQFRPVWARMASLLVAPAVWISSPVMAESVLLVLVLVVQQETSTSTLVIVDLRLVPMVAELEHRLTSRQEPVGSVTPLVLLVPVDLSTLLLVLVETVFQVPPQVVMVVMSPLLPVWVEPRTFLALVTVVTSSSLVVKETLLMTVMVGMSF